MTDVPFSSPFEFFIYFWSFGFDFWQWVLFASFKWSAAAEYEWDDAKWAARMKSNREFQESFGLSKRKFEKMNRGDYLYFAYERGAKHGGQRHIEGVPPIRFNPDGSRQLNLYGNLDRHLEDEYGYNVTGGASGRGYSDLYD